MTDQSNSENNTNETTRRDFIVLAANSLTAIGALSAGWTLVDTMNPSKDVLSLSTVEVNLAGIEQGQVITIKWRGKPVFIRCRTEDEISAMRLVKMTDLIDPEPDQERVKENHEKWLVTVGICTHLGCVPIANEGEYNGWFCPCHGSHYDLSGRIRKGPAPKNLLVPEYTFITEDKIKIG